MKQVILGSSFRLAYKHRIVPNPHLVKGFHATLKRFSKDRLDPQLDDHALSGKMQHLRAFSLTGDLRIVYKETDQAIILIDIGRHNEVYY